MPLAKQSALIPGSQWNPLFIYGGVGLGKTHLLQATGREIMRNFPDKVVVYFSAERFLNELVEAIKNTMLMILKPDTEMWMF